MNNWTLKKMETLLLDTTLRQLANKLFYSFNHIKKSFVGSKDRIDINLRVRHLLYFSVLAHALVFLAIMSSKQSFINPSMGSKKASETVEFVAIPSSFTVEPKSKPHGPREVIARQNSKRILDKLKKLSKTQMKDFKPKSEELRKNQLAKKLAFRGGPGTSKSGFLGSPLSIDKNLFKIENSTTSREITSSDLLKVINNHDLVFQKCYEKALLSDENLAGQVEFYLKTNTAGEVANSKVLFTGKGSPQSQKMLSSCLSSVSEKIAFSTHAANIKIKFNLLML